MLFFFLASVWWDTSQKLMLMFLLHWWRSEHDLTQFLPLHFPRPPRRHFRWSSFLPWWNTCHRRWQHSMDMNHTFWHTHVVTFFLLTFSMLSWWGERLSCWKRTAEDALRLRIWTTPLLVNSNSFPKACSISSEYWRPSDASTGSSLTCYGKIETGNNEYLTS